MNYHTIYTSEPRRFRALTIAIAATIALAWANYGRAAEPTIYIGGQVGESIGSRHTFYPDPPNTPYAPEPTVVRGSRMPTGRGSIGLSIGGWDVELGLGNLGHYQQARECKGATDICDVAGYGIMASEIDLRARYWQPVAGHFSVYAEAGIARAHWHATQWVFDDVKPGEMTGGWVSMSGISYAPQFGAGVGYDVSRHFRLTAGVTETLNVSGARFMALQAGLRFSF
jgi:opacity protein-like surface antigen